MIGSLIGAGIGAITSVFGAMKARKEAKKADAKLKKELDYNQAWYDRRYNEDATQKADAQRILNMAMERIKNRRQAAEGRAKVAGASEESAYNDQQAAAAMYGDTASQIAANGVADAQRVESQYMTNRSNLTGQQIARHDNNAANIGTATSAATRALANAGAAIDELREADKNRQWLTDLLKS